MSDILSILFGSVVYFVIELYTFLSLFPMRFGKRKTALIYALLQVIAVSKQFLLFDHMVIKALLQWGISIFTITVLFKGKLWKKLLVYIGLIAIVGAAESGLVVVSSLLLGENFFADHTLNFVFMIADAACAMFLVLIYVQILKHKLESFEKKSARFIGMYVLIQLLLFLVIYSILWDYRLNATPIMLLFLAVIGVSVGFGVALIRLVKASAAETARAEQIEAQMKLSDEHFKRLQLQYEQYRKLRHDYYNHVSTIKGIKDEAERDAYIDDLTKQIESHRGITFCSNAAVDALLFNEKAQADKVGVKIEFKIADLDSLTISSIDLCTILSNLIDNAIRGASEVDGEDKRFVSVSVFPRAGQLIVNVRNGSLPPKEDLSTTKKHAKDEEHGLGLTIVREVAERHDGAAVYSFSDGVFEASVSVAG